MQWRRKMFLDRRAGKRGCEAAEALFRTECEKFLDPFFSNEERFLVASHYMYLHYIYCYSQ